MCEIKPVKCNQHSPIMDHNNGELICAKCGLVVGEERLKTKIEWKPK